MVTLQHSEISNFDQRWNFDLSFNFRLLIYECLLPLTGMNHFDNY